MTPNETALLLLGATAGSLLSTAANLGMDMVADARARRRAARNHFRSSAKVMVSSDHIGGTDNVISQADRGGAA